MPIVKRADIKGKMTVSGTLLECPGCGHKDVGRPRKCPDCGRTMEVVSTSKKA
jgi:predicted RNA-binding Zn-ribbon protein involved in translation (DUF1610 family)